MAKRLYTYIIIVAAIVLSISFIKHNDDEKVT